MGKVLSLEQVRSLAGDPLSSVVDVLQKYGLGYQGNSEDNFCFVQKDNQVVSLELESDGYVFQLLTVSPRGRRGKVLNVVSYEYNFSGVRTAKTEAFSYELNKKHFEGSFLSVQVFVRRLERIFIMADFLSKKIGKEKKISEIVALLYCNVTKSSSRRYSRFKDNKHHSIAESLRFIKNDVPFSKIIELWELNITSEMFFTYGDAVYDLPDDVREALN